MDRQTLLELWDGSWDGDIWFAPWTKALAGLTPQQATWKPGPGRHSIWQNVSHVAFWREYSTALVHNLPKPSKEDVERRNFEEPAAVTVPAWDAAKKRLEETHHQVRSVIADPTLPLDRVKYHLAHDAYHLGQIMQTRAMQGLDPVM